MVTTKFHDNIGKINMYKTPAFSIEDSSCKCGASCAELRKDEGEENMKEGRIKTIDKLDDK